MSRRIETYSINEVTVKLPWNENLKTGPIDDYLEVIDIDPASQAVYVPVNLNDGLLLAQDGVPPSEGNPQFHQQMVYAVARKTISHFEQALGRRVVWSPRLQAKGEKKNKAVERLRIYPHALREANAYYSPKKKALLFGYFPASQIKPGENIPGEIVFTCLSHDIIAHETTHALLDGLHKYFIEPSNPDVLAFHEAFADIVALFQHFTYPEALKHQIAKTKGDLQSSNLLSELAYQFGQATESYGALRSAIGEYDIETGEWKPKKPDPEAIITTMEPHDRGSILVAAIFQAFLSIYRSRISDLIRIATGGTGVLPNGELHPDLVFRVAKEASKAAEHILHICIRALDYCVPVDINFGDYLRALITADKDYAADDSRNYRLAIIEAFRLYGIYPHNVRNMSEESLLWQPPSLEEQKIYTKIFGKSKDLRNIVPNWGLSNDPIEIYLACVEAQKALENKIIEAYESEKITIPYLALDDSDKAKRTFYMRAGLPEFEVHSVRPARRLGLNGEPINDLVVEIVQRRRGFCDLEKQNQDNLESKKDDPDFVFRGGCTILINLESGEVRYCIYKNIGSKGDDRLERQRKFFMSYLPGTAQTSYYQPIHQSYYREMIKAEKFKQTFEMESFALIHRSYEKMGVRK